MVLSAMSALPRLKPFLILLVPSTFVFLLAACSDQNAAYYSGSAKNKAVMKGLFHSLEQQDSSPERRFGTIQRIINNYYTQPDTLTMNLFLTSYVKTHPNDPYDAYYLLLVAENYRKEGADPFAMYYFDRILRNYPDLTWKGEQSVHLTCLQNLIKLEESPQIRVDYYKELIFRFADSIDKGNTYYALAKTYEQLGEWDLAMQAYRKFLMYPDTVVPGHPNAHQEVQDLVTLYDMPDKNWPMESLDDLVARIRTAIRSQSAQRVNALRSKVDFFARAWGEEVTAKTNMALVSDIGAFLQLGIWVSSTLDPDSNDQEAYLKTTGWGYRISTWYLYFKKIDFPADPNIHGKWEWAGIYLGQKPY